MEGQSLNSINSWWTEIVEEGGKKGCITLIHTNIRSVRLHWDELMAVLKDVLDEIDVLVLSETNLSNEEVCVFNINNFESIWYNRQERRGGGVLVFVRKKWKVKVTPTSFQSAESVQISIRNAQRQIILLAVYRPPQLSKHDFNTELAQWLQKNRERSVIIVGDINIDISKNNGVVSDYLSVMSEFGTVPLIREVTREEVYRDCVTRSCIDHVNVRYCSGQCIGNVINEKIADHYFVTLVIRDELRPDVHQTVVSLNNTQVNQRIRTANWSDIRKLKDPDVIYKQIVTTFKNIYELSRREVVVRRRKPENVWINSEIIELIKERQNAWRQYKKHPESAQKKGAYLVLRNKVTSLIRLTKRAYFWNKFAECKDPASKWKLINQMMGRKARPNVDETIINNFGTAQSSTEIASKFNTEFLESVNSLCGDTRLNGTRDYQVRSSNSIYFPEITEDDVLKIVKGMKSNKAVGYDGIRPRDIKENIDILSGCLTDLFNRIFETGVVPGDMKTAVIRPLYKKGSKDDVLSYRPVSVLSSLSYIMEKYVSIKLVEFLEKMNILSDHQYGFRAKKSTIQLLEDFNDTVNSALDKGWLSVSLFIDFSRAFETINHSILLERLYSMGIRGPLHVWFKGFLHNRQQTVKINGTFSERLSLLHGVPQGSVLGPLLFILYVNELSQIPLEGTLFQFADDTALVVSQHRYDTAIEIIKNDIRKLMRWYRGSQIVVNAEKTKIIVFRHPHKTIGNLQVRIHGDNCECLNCPQIQCVNTIKYLGLYLDSNMKWHTHVEHVCKKLRTLSAHLYFVKRNAPISITRSIYFAIGLSSLNYGITVYGSCAQYLKNRIESAHRRLLRNVVPYWMHGETGKDMYTESGILDFNSLFRYNILHRNYNSIEYKKTDITGRNLRSGEHYKVPFCKTEYGKCTRRYIVPREFNRLPTKLRALKPVTRVKKAIRKWLLMK